MINLMGMGMIDQVNYALHYMTLFRQAKDAGLDPVSCHRFASGEYDARLADPIEDEPGIDDICRCTGDDYCDDCIPF